MAEPVCRAGTDVHSCGALDTEGSPNVFVNGAPVHRIGDGDSHSGTQDEGSSTVFANGLGVARVGDNNTGEPVPPFHPPNPEASGSPNIFAGG